MSFQDYLDLTKDALEVETIQQLSTYSYILKNSQRTFKLYQQGQQVVLEGSLGTPMKDTSETNTMLSELLQFNLKRVQFLDNIIFLDNDTRLLFLRAILPQGNASSEQLNAYIEDFVLNIEVIEGRFFPELK